MAEFIEVMKQRDRMCKSNGCNCFGCGLALKNNGKELRCDDFCCSYPQEAEKIIMDWAKEHPVMTNADKFKEVFGIEIGHEFEKCDLFTCSDDGCDKCEYYGFWNREYIEPKKENEDGKID